MNDTAVAHMPFRKAEMRNLLRIIHARAIALPIRGNNGLSVNGLVGVNTRGVFQSFWGEKH